MAQADLATTGSVGRAVAAAVLMGLVASVLPARRLARLDPATAYREADGDRPDRAFATQAGVSRP